MIECGIKLGKNNELLQLKCYHGSTSGFSPESMTLLNRVALPRASGETISQPLQ